MQKVNYCADNSRGFVIHGIPGTLVGSKHKRISAYYDKDGYLLDAEAIRDNGTTQSLPMNCRNVREHLNKIGQRCKDVNPNKA